MQVHLVDGTYELFRHFFALPSHLDADGNEMAAARGVVGSVVMMLENGATHLGVATDHVVESFRNDMWEGYKTGEGMEPTLLEQFHPLENLLGALGIAVWPMVEFEADDGLASAAAVASADSRVKKVFICTPDKDLAQCVEGSRVVLMDRRKNVISDTKGVVEKFGVPPESITDYLALVGDTADGFPGLPGWGAKSAATVLARYGHLENIPDDVETWKVKPRSAARLADALAEGREDAMLFKQLATLRTDAPVGRSVDDWHWQGPSEHFAPMCEKLGAMNLLKRAERIAAKQA
ncbi:MAG: 5'-3' exonuclease H3TH domain-containing protein [Candidatus Binatia bacterium]|nr:5'-3' exonuclease H3TH domain-containing protein [Candidatus Binatia bacterium]